MLDLRPLALRRSETQESGNEDILVPRFGEHALGRWLMGKVRKPYHRISLDEVGTFIWRRLDGDTSVQEIGDSLKQKFGERVEPVFDRLNVFIAQLERANVIDVKGP